MPAGRKAPRHCASQALAHRVAGADVGVECDGKPDNPQIAARQHARLLRDRHSPGLGQDWALVSERPKLGPFFERLKVRVASDIPCRRGFSKYCRSARDLNACTATVSFETETALARNALCALFTLDEIVKCRSTSGRLAVP